MEDHPTGAPIRFRNLSPALELLAWIMVGLAPLLRLANGAPVTDDQWYFQIAVATAAVTIALVLRIVNWRFRREQQA